MQPKFILVTNTDGNRKMILRVDLIISAEETVDGYTMICYDHGSLRRYISVRETAVYILEKIRKLS